MTGEGQVSGVDQHAALLNDMRQRIDALERVSHVHNPVWIAVAGGVGFQNGWVNIGTSPTNQPVEYRRVGDLVQIRGACKSGTVGFVTCFNLPVGYRPVAPVAFAAHSNLAFAAWFVSAAGNIQIIAGNNVGVDLMGWFSIAP